MNQVTTTIERAIPICGQVASHTGSMTVVVELGPETLRSLERLAAALEQGASRNRLGEIQGLPQPLMLTADDEHCSKRASPYLLAKEAAEYLGINVKSLYGLVERRQLEPFRGPKRTYRFTTEMLDEYLRSRR